MPDTSLARRALVALALMIGFYAMALAIASFLLWLTWIQVSAREFRGVFFFVVGAIVILYSIAPRIDRFQAPGPELIGSRHPDLFRVIREVASKTKQAMPEGVYLIPDANAFVTARGGVMGFGSRRVMGIGLPLFDALSIAELRSVLAHEFGHFDGGDTKLGPWIYKTRAAIGLTLENLEKHSSLLQIPFQWYGNFFLKVTQSISRQQELNADVLACRIAGSRAAEDALVKLHRVGPAYEAYMDGEVRPIVEAGFRPPLLDGFSQFLRAERIVKQSEEALQEEMNRVVADAVDSHPPLGERLAAIRRLSMKKPLASQDELPAGSLLRDREGVEESILRFLSPETQTLTPIRWEDAGEKVFAESWRSTVTSFGESLRGIRIKDLPRAIQRREEFPGLVDTKDVPAEIRGTIAQGILASALADSLVTAGWRIDTVPGAEVRMVKDAYSIDPFTVTNELIAGDLSAADWQKRTEDLGIAMLELAAGNAKEA